MYKIANPIMVRMPIYSYEKYQNISLSNNVDDFIETFSRDPIFLRAISISSPTFYRYHCEYSDIKYNSDKYRDSMFKYISRSTARATPFGAFSVVSFGKTGKETFVTHTAHHESFLSCRVDASLFWKMIQKLEASRATCAQLSVVINPNLYTSNIRVKNPYVSYLGQSRDHTSQISIRKSKQFEAVMRFAQKPIKVKDLSTLLYVHNGGKVNKEKIDDYIENLIEHEFLISELRFFDACAGVSKILDVCRRSGISGAICEDIDIVGQLIAKLDVETNLEKWLRTYEHLSKLCYEKFGATDAINVAAFAPQCSTTLGKTVLDSVYSLERFLTETALPDNETPQLFSWKQIFKERFGPYAEVKFLDLFDDNCGIGDPYSLKNSVFSNSRPPSAKKKAMQNILESKILLALAKHEEQVVFTEKDFEPLHEFNNRLQFPSSLDIGINILAESTDSIMKGDFSIQVMDNIGTRTGGAHLSRFQEGMPQEVICEYQALQESKQRLVQDRYIEVFAREIPQNSRIANISNPNTSLTFSINLGMAGINNSLSLNDLYIGYNQTTDRLYIKSKKLQKIVKVTVDGVLNSFSTNHVLRLLREISDCYEINPLSSIALLRESPFEFIPDVWYKNVLLQEARWTIHTTVYTKKEFAEFKDTFINEKNRLGFNRYIFICDFDRKILIDAENDFCMRFLLRQIKKSKKIVIQKCNLPSEKWSLNPAGQAVHTELIVPMLLKQSDSMVFSVKKTHCERNDTTKYCVPMGDDNYIYLKLYLDMEYADKFLSDSLAPFVQNLYKSGRLDKFFFIRYADPNFHIRLRLRAKDRVSYTEFLIDIQKWANMVFRNKEVKNYAFTIYEREVERYGGEQCIGLIESLFSADSALAIKLLDYKKQLDIQTVDSLCAWIFAQTVLDLTPAGKLEDVIFIPPISKDAHHRYRLIKNRISSLINSNLTSSNANDEAIIQSVKERQVICLRLKKQFELLPLTNQISDIVRSIVHMTANRLSGNRIWEQEVTAYAMKTLKTYIFKSKN